MECTESIEETAKAGSFLHIDDGVFDGYYLVGFFRVNQDFSPMAEFRKFLELNPNQKPKEGFFNKDKFVNSLIENGLISEMKFDSFFLGEYDTHSGINFTKNTNQP